MLAVVGMCMIMNAAGFVIDNMRTHDKNKREWQQPVLVVMPNLLGDKKPYAGSENEYGHKAVMMTAVTMP